MFSLLSGAGVADAKRGVVENSVAKKSARLREQHWRLESPAGPLHVWRPAGYRAESAGLVIYVHGHRATPDSAWRDFSLRKKFKNSGQNALFIVPAAQSMGGEPVPWPNLDGLLSAVYSGSGEHPAGPIVVIGHSGAFRTILGWIADPRIVHLCLIDALYDGTDQFRAWLDQPSTTERKMTLIAAGGSPLEHSKELILGLDGVVSRGSIPNRFTDLSRKERRARVLFMKSQFGHMDLVERAELIPLFLRRTPLTLLK